MGRVSAEDQPGPERRRHLPGGRTRRIPLRRGSACRRASGEARGEPTALKAFDRLARFAKPLPRMACPLQILDDARQGLRLDEMDGVLAGFAQKRMDDRSEERRGGKECVRK